MAFNMRSFKTLRKIHKHKAESLARKIMSISFDLKNAQETLNYLEHEEADQIKRYCGSSYGFAVGNFLKSSRLKQKACKEKIFKLKQDLSWFESALKNEYSTLKRFEIIIKNKEQEEILLNISREVSAQDEINTIRYFTKVI